MSKELFFTKINPAIHSITRFFFIKATVGRSKKKCVPTFFLSEVFSLHQQIRHARNQLSVALYNWINGN